MLPYGVVPDSPPCEGYWSSRQRGRYEITVQSEHYARRDFDNRNSVSDRKNGSWTPTHQGDERAYPLLPRIQGPGPRTRSEGA